MKLVKFLIIVIAILFGIIYFFGSRPDDFSISPTIETSLMTTDQIEREIKNHEKSFNIRPGNEAQIIWADSTKKKTSYSLVYLHGFSASHMEGNPVHKAIAKRYGMNLYLTRLSGHGIMGEAPLENFKADAYVESAKDALRIGQALGDDVIVMATSTGATAAIYLAAYNKELIDIMLLFAPNISIADPRSFLLTYPGGRELAEFLEGDYLKQGMTGPEFDKYWYPKYRTNSVVEVRSLIDETMTSAIFEQIDQPTFVSYYYKNDLEKDDIVSAYHIDKFYEHISTTSDRKRLIKTPNSGSHVTISSITSSDIITPYKEACDFLEKVAMLEVKDSMGYEEMLASFK